MPHGVETRAPGLEMEAIMAVHVSWVEDVVDLIDDDLDKTASTESLQQSKADLADDVWGVEALISELADFVSAAETRISEIEDELSDREVRDEGASGDIVASCSI